MISKLQQFFCAILAIGSLALFSLSALAAEDYYRWVSDDGVVHYGSRPPEGVDATKISTYGKSAATTSTSPEKAKSGATVANDDQKSVLEQRKQQCEDEKKRVNQLKTPGRRIRMEQPDGKSRYLTPEEISKEIATSQEFISEACK